MDFKLRTAVLLVGIITQISGWRPFIVKFQDESCEIIHPEMVNLNVTIKNQSFVYVQLNILRDIAQVFVDLIVSHDSGNGAYDMVFMNRTVDLCAFLNNRKSNPLIDIAYRMIEEYEDFPKRCPIRKKRYELRNVFVDPEKFPPFMVDHKAKVSAIAWNKYGGKKSFFAKCRLNVIIERSFRRNGN